MATTKLAFLAIAVLLLQVSWCVVAQKNGTQAVMAVTSFQSGPTACDEGKPHSDKEMIAALSTDFFGGGKMCHKHIRITNPKNGRNLVAEVVDECDTQNGCEEKMIATPKGVWRALSLNTDIGVVPVTLSIAK